LVDELNENLGSLKMKFNQQQVSTGNMSLSGGNGRVWITPCSSGCDVSLSGKSLESELSHTGSYSAGSVMVTSRRIGRQERRMLRFGEQIT
jgi:hypothetical protein